MRITKPPTKSQAGLMDLARAVLAGDPDRITGEPSPLTKTKHRQAWEDHLLHPHTRMDTPAPKSFAAVFKATKLALTTLVELAEGQGELPCRLRGRVCRAIHSELAELLEEWGSLERAASEGVA